MKSEMMAYPYRGIFLGCMIVLLSCALIIMLSSGCTGEFSEEYIYYENVLGTFPDFTPDPDDETPPKILQEIPPNGTMDLTPSLSVVLFFDDEINPETMTSDTIQVYKEQYSPENMILGRFGAVLSKFGNTILFFVPDQQLDEEENIYIKLLGAGIRDDGDNYLVSEEIIQIRTSNEINSPSNLDFEEEDDEGYEFIGDGIIRGAAGDISPQWGIRMAAISTISTLNETLSSSYAIDGTTSMLATGPIDVPEGASKLLFEYDFLSEEFDEYVDTEYDDTFIVSVSGPDDVYATVVTSVNMIGQDDSRSIPLNNIGDMHVFDADHTGWITREIELNGTGSPLTIFFCVSDVGDAAVDSIVLIDNIRFE